MLMSLPHVIPGLFPGESRDPFAVAILGQPSTSYHQLTLELSVDDALQALFAVRELGGCRTTAQKHLIGQLDALTYFVIGFQFLKYTHGSCMPPAIAHFLVSFLLHARKFIATGPESGRQIFAEHLNSQEQHFQAAGLTFDRRKIVKFIVGRTHHLILWKFLACVVYHTLLVVLYLQPVANEGKLYLLEYGLWYSISFVGETVSRNYSASDPWWLRLWKLGFCGLLFLDVVILILQLIIYQSIFLQSTISPKGLRLNERERYILRAQGAGSGTDLDSDNGVPVIIHVKLYESLGEDPMAEISV